MAREPLRAFVRKLRLGLGWAWRCTCPARYTFACFFPNQADAYADAFQHMRTHLVQREPIDSPNVEGTTWCRICGHDLAWHDGWWLCSEDCAAFTGSWYMPDPNAKAAT